MIALLVADALAVRVQLLPDVIDFTLIPDAAGTFGLLCALIGAALEFGPNRLGRFTLFGNLVGGIAAVFVLLVAGMRHVLS